MKVSILTLGCKVNKYESDQIQKSFQKDGWQTSSSLEFADVFVINTCAVTAEAEKKSRQMVARCLKFNKDAKIYICGCASQNNPQQFLLPNVKFIKGVSAKEAIIHDLQNSGVFIEEFSSKYQEYQAGTSNNVRAYVKIQDGCNNFCSYCIIPYLRGRSRSRDLQHIVKEVQNLPSFVKEIVLTGINISDYKIDNQKALIQVLQQVDKFGKRVRLGSLEDCIIDEDFVSKLADLKNFCTHFHLSLQSGCDSVLKRMNRHYTTAQFRESTSLIKKYFPTAAITTDVIVGFCDESQQEFEQTLDFIKDIGFADIHVFKYSKREGTASYNNPDLPAEVKKTRLNIVQDLAKQLQNQFIMQQDMFSVLIDEEDDQFFMGYSKNYIKIYLNKTRGLKVGDIVNVQTKKIYKNGVFAYLV